MPDLVVTPTWNHYAVRDRMGMYHAATIYDDCLYVWCYGPSTSGLWTKQGVEIDAPVNCLTCLAYGPRPDWEPAALGRWRNEMREGRRIAIADTETKPWPRG